MQPMLLHAHSGLRYLVLLAGVVALVVFLIGRFTGKPFGRSHRVAGSIFMGLLDLQVLLGVILFAVGPRYGALMGHVAMMVLAVATAHIVRVRAKRAESDSKRFTLHIVAVLLPLLFILAGITAIGRSII